MQLAKPKTRQPKSQPTPLPYGYRRKNGRLVIDPVKQEFIKELYEKFAGDAELMSNTYEALAEWWHQNNSRAAKKLYQLKHTRQQTPGGK